jgi:hypothetical protein
LALLRVAREKKGQVTAIGQAALDLRVNMSGQPTKARQLPAPGSP